MRSTRANCCKSAKSDNEAKKLIVNFWSPSQTQQSQLSWALLWLTTWNNLLLVLKSILLVRSLKSCDKDEQPERHIQTCNPEKDLVLYFFDCSTALLFINFHSTHPKAPHFALYNTFFFLSRFNYYKFFNLSLFPEITLKTSSFSLPTQEY